MTPWQYADAIARNLGLPLDDDQMMEAARIIRLAIDYAIVQRNQAREEIEVLRQYGNKDCMAMADEELNRRRSEASDQRTGEK